MFGTEMIAIIVAMLLSYMLLSTVCSALNEWIAAVTASRSRYLSAGIMRLLNDPNGTFQVNGKSLYNELVEHPLVKGLTGPGYLDRFSHGFKWPAYLPSVHFATAFLDTLAPAQSAGQPRTLAEIHEAIDALRPGDLQRTLVLLANDSENDLDRLRKNLERWYDEGMVRVSGWYKRYTQVSIIVIALIVAVSLNVDTFMMLRLLSSDPTTRSQLVAAAQVEINGVNNLPPNQKPDPDAALLRLLASRSQLNAVPLPIGWTATDDLEDDRRVPGDLRGWSLKVPGFVISTIALSMGAPFYFDLLKKFVNVRLAGTAPGEKDKGK